MNLWSNRGTLQEVGVGDNMGSSGEELHSKSPSGEKKKGGLSFPMAAFFLVTQVRLTIKSNSYIF